MPTLMRADLAPGAGLSTGCSASVNMSPETGQCVHPNNKRINVPYCGWVAAKCQSFSVYFFTQKNDAAAILPASNAEENKYSDLLSNGCTQHGEKDPRVFIKYKFAMWKHTFCFWEKSGDEPPRVKCKSTKMCSCSRFTIGGERTGAISLHDRLFGKPNELENMQELGEEETRRRKKSVGGDKEGRRRKASKTEDNTSHFPTTKTVGGDKEVRRRKASKTEDDTSHFPTTKSPGKKNCICKKRDDCVPGGGLKGPAKDISAVREAMCGALPEAVKTIQKQQCTQW